MSNVVIDNAPVDSGEFARYKQRLLKHDWRAAGMLERLYINTRASASTLTADMHELRIWTIFALCAVGRGKDAEALIREDKVILLDTEGDPRFRRLMSFRFKWLRWAAARYAISSYRFCPVPLSTKGRIPLLLLEGASALFNFTPVHMFDFCIYKVYKY